MLQQALTVGWIFTLLRGLLTIPVKLAPASQTPTPPLPINTTTTMTTFSSYFQVMLMVMMIIGGWYWLSLWLLSSILSRLGLSTFDPIKYSLILIISWALSVFPCSIIIRYIYIFVRICFTSGPIFIILFMCSLNLRFFIIILFDLIFYVF